MSIDLYSGDCLEILQYLPSGSVDLVLADPPYGTTANKWDSVIPLPELWSELKRIVKSDAAIIMTASQPFTTTLIHSNLEDFKYCWVWEKEQGSMPMNAPYQPIKCHEDCVVFSKRASTYSPRGVMRYFPIKTSGTPYSASTRKDGSMIFNTSPSGDHFNDNLGTRYPRSVQKFSTERGLHPTQKPIALMEYLIKTYTKENEVVCDFAMGSGTTGVAAKRCGRDFIGMELDPDYYQMAKKRIED